MHWIEELSHRAKSFAQSLVLVTGLGLALATQGTAQTTAPMAPPSVSGPTGLWLDHTGRGAVEIVQCASELCGRIVWLKDSLDPSGKPLVDTQNAEKSKRGTPICGLQIIGGLKRQPDGSWDDGWIYDPEEGERFDLELRLRGPEQLQVKGYKGLKFLSETFQWRRIAEVPGPRCAT